MSQRSARHRQRLRKRPTHKPVTPSRVTQFVDRAQELCAVRGLDALFHHENWPPVILDFSRDCRRAPVRRRGEIHSGAGLKLPPPSQRNSEDYARRRHEIGDWQPRHGGEFSPHGAADSCRAKDETQEYREPATS
jgi:hypothetical protein